MIDGSKIQAAPRVHRWAKGANHHRRRQHPGAGWRLSGAARSRGHQRYRRHPPVDGTIVVNAPEVDLSGGLVVLEGALLDAASQLRERCRARRDIGASSFTGVGRGGLPPGPDAPLAGAYLGRDTAGGATRAGAGGRAAEERAGRSGLGCRGRGAVRGLARSGDGFALDAALRTRFTGAKHSVATRPPVKPGGTFQGPDGTGWAPISLVAYAGSAPWRRRPARSAPWRPGQRRLARPVILMIDAGRDLRSVEFTYIGASSFTGVGRGGLPPSPDGPLGSAYPSAYGAPRRAVAAPQEGGKAADGSSPQKERLGRRLQASRRAMARSRPRRAPSGAAPA